MTAASIVLAFDTSGPCSTATILRQEEVLVTSDLAAEGQHAERLLGQLQSLLQLAGLSLSAVDCLVVGLGPGNFTGLRVGLATAKALHFATGLPVRATCSLLGLLPPRADADEPEALHITCSDALRGELYLAAYRWPPIGDLPITLVPPSCLTPNAALLLLQQTGQLDDAACVWVRGSGAGICQAAWSLAPGSWRFDASPPKASWLAAHARHEPTLPPTALAALEPLYLRAPDAALPAQPLRTS